MQASLPADMVAPVLVAGALGTGPQSRASSATKLTQRETVSWWKMGRWQTQKQQCFHCLLKGPLRMMAATQTIIKKSWWGYWGDDRGPSLQQEVFRTIGTQGQLFSPAFLDSGERDARHRKRILKQGYCCDKSHSWNQEERQKHPLTSLRSSFNDLKASLVSCNFSFFFFLFSFKWQRTCNNCYMYYCNM